MRHLAALTLLLITLACEAATESERFNAWLASDWEEVLPRSPITATFIGDPRYNDRFVDTTTAAWRDEELAFQEKRLATLRTFDRSKLALKEQTSYDVMASDIDDFVAGRRFPYWMQPLTQTFAFPSFLAQLGSGASVQPFRTVKDYENWFARLHAAWPMLDGYIANMRVGMQQGVVQPRVLMEKVLPQLAAIADAAPEQNIFWGSIRAFPADIPAAERERLTARYRALLADEVLPAYRRLHAFVRDEYLPKARTTTAWSDLPDGRAWYAYLVRTSTTTDLTPDEIHALGLREVARNLELMDAVRWEVGFQGDRRAFFAHMRDDPRYHFRQPEEVLDAFRALQKRINVALPKLFDIAPKADYEVRAVEAFRADSAAAAMYTPASADGTRPGVFWVNALRPERLFNYQTETLSLHEASPGHHFQSSIAAEDKALPAFRRFGAFNVAYVEGWGLYAESLGRDLGLFTDPLQWYGRVAADQLRAMRLVVDTGLHHKGWTRQQAIDYMLANSSMNAGDVVSEVERYIAMPSQALGYKIGQLEIQKLRDEAKARLGDRFDIKAFHREVLTMGSVPMKVLKARIEQWIGEQQAGRKPS